MITTLRTTLKKNFNGIAPADIYNPLINYTWATTISGSQTLLTNSGTSGIISSSVNNDWLNLTSEFNHEKLDDGQLGRLFLNDIIGDGKTSISLSLATSSLLTTLEGTRLLSNNISGKYLPLREADFSFSTIVIGDLYTQEVATTLSEVVTLVNNAVSDTKITVVINTFPVDEVMEFTQTGYKIVIDFQNSIIRGLITFRGNNTILTNCTLTGGTYSSTTWTNGAGVFNYGLDNGLVNVTFDDAGQRSWIVSWEDSKRFIVKNILFQNKTNNNTATVGGSHFIMIMFRYIDDVVADNHLVIDSMVRDIPLLSLNGGESFSCQIQDAPYPSNTPDWYTNHAIYGINTGITLENMIFARCDGDGEVVSVKTNGFTIKNASFIDCAGALSLRQGQNHNVDNIHFIHTNSDFNIDDFRMGCKNTNISNIYFYNARGDAIGIHQGGSTSGTPSSGAWYQQSENITIKNVTVFNARERAIRTIATEPDPLNDLQPINCSYGNVVAIDCLSSAFLDMDRQIGATYINNFVQGTASYDYTPPNTTIGAIATTEILEYTVIPDIINSGVKYNLGTTTIPETGGATYLNQSQSITIDALPALTDWTMSFSIKMIDNTLWNTILGRSDGYRYIQIRDDDLYIRSDGSTNHAIPLSVTMVNNQRYEIILTVKAGLLTIIVDNVIVATDSTAPNTLDIGFDRVGESIGSTARVIDATISNLYIIDGAISEQDKEVLKNNKEKFFNHTSALSFTKTDVKLSMPLGEVGTIRHDYVSGNDYTISGYTSSCDIQGLSTGMQKDIRGGTAYPSKYLSTLVLPLDMCLDGIDTTNNVVSLLPSLDINTDEHNIALQDIGNNGKYYTLNLENDAIVYSGKAMSLDDTQSVDLLFAGTIDTVVYMKDGVLVYNESLADSSGTYTISGVGVYQNIILYNGTFTTTEKAYLLATPHQFLYREDNITKSGILPQTKIDLLADWFPCFDDDEFVRSATSSTVGTIVNYDINARQVNLVYGIQTMFYNLDAENKPIGLFLLQFNSDGIGYANTGWIPNGAFQVEEVVLLNGTFTHFVYDENGNKFTNGIADGTYIVPNISTLLNEKTFDSVATVTEIRLFKVHTTPQNTLTLYNKAVNAGLLN